MKELRLFLLFVGLPAIVLMVAGARLVYVEWRFDTHESEMRGAPPPKPEDDWKVDEPPPKPDDERDFHSPPPEPPSVLHLFSEKYSMDGPRDLTIFGCLVGLMLLSLVSGSWLLMRTARKARLEALQQTDFVSNISHEFKTPLTTICLCAELAQDAGLDATRRQKALSAIASEAERLKRLVVNALDFSRLEKNRYNFCLRRIDVADIARESCAAVSSRFAEGQLRAPEGNCEAYADADAVRQILVNLLDNAAKYAPKGEVEVSVMKCGENVRVSVADHGAGLSDDERKHVFDRFWRGDNSLTRETGGSGLGLAIARGLARGMGGDLTAANRNDGGAIFTLELKS